MLPAGSPRATCYPVGGKNLEKISLGEERVKKAPIMLCSKFGGKAAAMLGKALRFVAVQIIYSSVLVQDEIITANKVT